MPRAVQAASAIRELIAGLAALAVGGQPLKEFRNVRHRVPMLSLEKAEDRRGLELFEARLAKDLAGEKIEYVVRCAGEALQVVRYNAGLGDVVADGATVSLRFGEDEVICLNGWADIAKVDWPRTALPRAAAKKSSSRSRINRHGFRSARTGTD